MEIEDRKELEEGECSSEEEECTHDKSPGQGKGKHEFYTQTINSSSDTTQSRGEVLYFQFRS